MKKYFKSIVLMLCVLTLPLFFGCGALETSTSADADAEPASYDYDGSLISGLLDRIMASANQVESFPALITSAQLVRQGCLLHYDKLAYNDNYKRGSAKPEESYFLNEEELDEQVAVTGAYLNCSKVASPYLEKKFVEYISSKKNGANFTLYWLDGQVIFVSEINIP